MTKQEYYLYLKSNKWSSIRTHAIRKAQNSCQVCDSPNNLQCHHRRYNNIGNENIDDLIVLCSDCHKIYHKNMPDCELNCFVSDDYYLVKKIESLHERKRLGMEHFDSYETDIAEVMQIIETLELTI